MTKTFNYCRALHPLNGTDITVTEVCKSSADFRLSGQSVAASREQRLKTFERKEPAIGAPRSGRASMRVPGRSGRV
jgi:hypothetical protein